MVDLDVNQAARADYSLPSNGLSTIRAACRDTKQGVVCTGLCATRLFSTIGGEAALKLACNLLGCCGAHQQQTRLQLLQQLQLPTAQVSVGTYISLDCGHFAALRLGVVPAGCRYEPTGN